MFLPERIIAMSEKNEEIRTVVQFLILEGLEVSVASIQAMLHDKGILVQDVQIVPILEEEGGPLPVYHGLELV